MKAVPKGKCHRNKIRNPNIEILKQTEENQNQIAFTETPEK
jgi:hypothetical protein